jgi:hypothetical protein
MALSYTWDVMATLHSIELNGLEFPIRENLHAALVQLRRPFTSVCQWADAICINQASIPDRNSQVPLMREIYSGATTVLIWLGEGNEQTEHGIEALRRLAIMSHDSDWIQNDLHKLLPHELKFPSLECAER